MMDIFKELAKSEDKVAVCRESYFGIKYDKNLKCFVWCNRDGSNWSNRKVIFSPMITDVKWELKDVRLSVILRAALEEKDAEQFEALLDVFSEMAADEKISEEIRNSYLKKLIQNLK